jgi:hypothetical protein
VGILEEQNVLDGGHLCRSRIGIFLDRQNGFCGHGQDRSRVHDDYLFTARHCEGASVEQKKPEGVGGSLRRISTKFIRETLEVNIFSAKSENFALF